MKFDLAGFSPSLLVKNRLNSPAQQTLRTPAPNQQSYSLPPIIDSLLSPASQFLYLKK